MLLILRYHKSGGVRESRDVLVNCWRWESGSGSSILVSSAAANFFQQRHIWCQESAIVGRASGRMRRAPF